MPYGSPGAGCAAAMKSRNLPLVVPNDPAARCVGRRPATSVSFMDAVNPMDGSPGRV
ncbi:MAG: hypothetical protein JWN06_3144 [Propionibacteriaceae bacterium]|nr:hypothetical protein [Propionibacteriaceae bacterium]